VKARDGREHIRQILRGFCYFAGVVLRMGCRSVTAECATAAGKRDGTRQLRRRILE
jgi:hypothetical protein